MTPRRAVQGELPAVLALVRAEFAYMDGVVDPPSTVHALTLEALAGAEVWVVGTPVQACMVLTPKPPVLYLGKLAVAGPARGQGLARVLVEAAMARAATLGLAAVELGTRVELVANQRAFERMGFVEVAREAHPGFDRPTSIVYQRALDPKEPT